MELTVIGSGTSLPQDGRGAPGYVIRVDGGPIVFDLGPGTVHRWARAGVSFLDVAEVLISHLHPDHVTDLVTLLFACRSPVIRRVKPLRIAGPAGLEALYGRLHDMCGAWVEDAGYGLEIRELEGGEIRRAGYRLTARQVRHTAGSLGYRLESREGKVIAYSGDTDYCEGIVELGRGADLLLLECSVPEERRVEGHLTPTRAGEIAAECGAGRLVLTHFYPLFEAIDIVERVRKSYDGGIILAEDLQRVEV